MSFYNDPQWAEVNFDTNLDMLALNDEPNTWSVSAKFPSSGSKSCHYFFKGFLSFTSNVNAQDQAVVPFEVGGQEVVIPFYTHEHRFSLEMTSDENTTNYQKTALWRAEHFLRSVRRLTDDTDQSWEIMYRWTKLLTAGKEPVMIIIGKIGNVTLNAQPKLHVTKVQVDISIFEDTEN